MTTGYLALIAVFILCRIPLHYHEETSRRRDHMIKAILEIILILAIIGLQPCTAWIVTCSGLASVLEYSWESRTQSKGSPYQERLLCLGLLLFLSSLWMPEPGMPQHLSWLGQRIQELLPYSLLSKISPRYGWHDSIVLLVGILLSWVEANAMVRVIIKRLKLGPADQAVDISVYKRGRVIGICERLLILFSVLIGRFELAAFTLTAKGIVRYSKLDKEDFAEYFMVGTLVSTIIAGTIGLGILLLLSHPEMFLRIIPK